MASKKDYFGLDGLISLILAIIPVTAWICGAVTRISEGHLLAGILRLIFGFWIIWLIDLILMITKGSILRIL